MNYLYHQNPENMRGNFLMPLNELKLKHPSAYTEEIKKYNGREQLLERRIPTLNCLWNDVLHMTAVHPKKIIDALRQSGSGIKKGNWEWFKINPNLLNPEETTVYLYNKPDVTNYDNYSPFRISELQNYNQIGPKTLDYYRSTLSEGRRPLLFHWVPHILYRGRLNVNDLERMKV